MSEPEFDSTRIDDSGNTDTKKRERKPNAASGSKPKKGEIFSADDCTQKYFLLHALAMRMLGETTNKREKDFAERGASLSRLSTQYPIVGLIIKMFDPVFFVLGAYNDHADAIRNFRMRRKAAKEAKRAAAQGGGVMVIDGGQQPSEYQAPTH